MRDVRQLKLTQIEKNVGIRFIESKTGKITTVEWSDELGAAIEAIRGRLHRDTPIRTIYLICNRDGYECSEGSFNQAWQRLRVDLLDAGIEPFQLRDIRAKFGTDHPDGRKALRHSSEAVLQAASESPRFQGLRRILGTRERAFSAVFAPKKPVYTQRRDFLKGLLTAPLALSLPARAQAAVTLDDYCLNGSYSLSAALRDGPVRLLARDYECLPVRFRSRDVIQGIPGRSRLLFESPEPAFLPENTSQPTDGWHFQDFDVQCEAKGVRGQHAFGMLSCRRGTLQRIRAFDFGGSALLFFGQRIAFSGPGAPSIDAPCGWVGDEWQCSGVPAPSDSTACRVEDFEAWRCGVGFRLDGTPAPEGAPRVKGGTANMHLFIRPVAYNCDSDGFLVWQGASNTFIKPVAGQCGRNGVTVAWYSNVFEGLVVERNAGWGVQLATQHRETRDNAFPYIHNGGSNGMGLCNVTVPEIG